MLGAGDCPKVMWNPAKVPKRQHIVNSKKKPAWTDNCSGLSVCALPCEKTASRVPLLRFRCFKTPATPAEGEIASAEWFTIEQLKALSWVSETMHQLALDGLTRRTVIKSQPGITQRSSDYAVYRTNLATTFDQGVRVVIPSSRLNIHGAPNTDGEVIVYWMTAARRPYRNHALEHAVNLAREHGLPLVVIECLALHHRWANDRISTFVLQGMSDNRETFSTSGVTYIPYVETKRKEASTLLKTWLHHAFACVIDDYPTYYPKHVLNTALEVKPCEVHVVDSNGFMAMRAQGRDFSTAYSLRRHLHKTIREHMHEFPASRPLDGTEDLPIYDEKKIHAIFELANTPVTPYEFIWRVGEGGDVGRNALSTLSIDHDVQPVLGKRGVIWRDEGVGRSSSLTD